MNNTMHSSSKTPGVRRRVSRATLALAFLLMAALGVTGPAQAQTFTTLASVTGGASHSGLAQDPAGNLYGTTISGGSAFGTVFKLDPAGTVTVLYSFTGKADGGYPTGSLVLDAAGSLYGTTLVGGSSGFGTIFKLDPSGSETVLHSFTGGADGAQPEGLASDAVGNFYGTAATGGITTGPCSVNHGCGTVFKLDPSGTETTLHSFTGQAGDGSLPFGRLVIDAAGNLYGGTIASGGPGKIFKVDPAGTETIVYSSPGYSGEPNGGLVVDAAGNVYFTKTSGSHCTTTCGGSVLKLDPFGAVTGVHGFAGSPDGFGPDGLVLDQTGNLFGTTSEGGAGSCTAGQPPKQVGCGTLFKIDVAGNEIVLYSFTGQTDGRSPAPTLVQDTGNLYGTTGTTVFKLAAQLPDFSLSASALTPATVSAGGSASSTINVAAMNAFSGSVALSCSVTPKPALAPACSIMPASVMPGTSATLTMSTAAPSAALQAFGADSGLLFAFGLPLIGLAAIRLLPEAKPARRRGKRARALLPCLLFAGAILQVACGSSLSTSSGGKRTPAGTYTIMVTGISSGGALVHTTTRMLTVQ